jgi:hypothetical protein
MKRKRLLLGGYGKKKRTVHLGNTGARRRITYLSAGAWLIDSSNAAAMWAVDELIAGGVDPITKGLYCTDCGIGGMSNWGRPKK